MEEISFYNRGHEGPKGLKELSGHTVLSNGGVDENPVSISIHPQTQNH